MAAFNRRSALPFLTVLPGLFACGAGGNTNPIRDASAGTSPAANPSASIAFRFPAEPGAGVRLYRFPALEELEWQFELPRLAAGQLVGFASAEDQIYLRSTAQTLVALDLTSGRDRLLDTAVVAATLGPTGSPHLVRTDGSVATVVDRRAVNWEPILPIPPRFLWGTTRGRFLALIESEGARRLEIIADSSRRVTAELPAGLLTATLWGDLVAVAVDSGLFAISTANGTIEAFLPLPVPVTALAFSSAGHRLYAATASRELVVVDRFQFMILSRQTLPAPVEALRTGDLGRFLLMKPVERDSVWIMNALQPTSPLVSVDGSWDDELPIVSQHTTVLLRQGRDIVAVDPVTGSETGRVVNGAEDRWMTAEWDPKRPAMVVARETDTPAADTSAQTVPVYIQLSSTSNQSWAQARVDELRGANLNARVVMPNEYYDRYRVVLGPYPSRQEADNIGRRLGQPYFLTFLADSTASR